MVKCRYDQWEPGQASDAHVPAALLKQWLRELYIPLIPGKAGLLGTMENFFLNPL